MTFLDLIEFTFKFNLAAPDTATWIYVILTAVFCVLFLGFFWGRMWNNDWSLGGHIGSLVLVVLCAAGGAFGVLNLRGIARMEDWFQQERVTLARSVADSSRFNRGVLSSVWDQLVSKGGQENLTPPIEGGNEIRLASPEDAFALALTAAEEARSNLRNRLPFSLGIPVSVRNPSDIATETVDTINFSAARFPIIAAATNEWSSTAATLQANHALDTAYSTLKTGSADLKTASYLLLIFAFVVPLVVIPMGALGDIKINPKPKH